ncbi:hypothetical protein ACJX0J_017399, partial [Zea mays]
SQFAFPKSKKRMFIDPTVSLLHPNCIAQQPAGRVPNFALANNDTMMNVEPGDEEAFNHENSSMHRTSTGDLHWRLEYTEMIQIIIIHQSRLIIGWGQFEMKEETSIFELHTIE